MEKLQYKLIKNKYKGVRFIPRKGQGYFAINL